jgi:uroporphyrinogen-III synthase
MVAFVSPNAIDALLLRFHSRLSSRTSKWPTGVAIGAMGLGSVAALAAHGINSSNTRIFSPRDPERTDSETLLATLDLQYLQQRKVLIVRGESGRELLADALRAAKVEVEQVAAYRRAAPAFDADRQAQLANILEEPCDWVITSSESLRILLTWVAHIGGQQIVAKMQQQHLVVPHIRIAETAKQLGFQSITLTGSGDERLLLALQSCP